MHDTDQPSNSNDLTPKFEGFFLQMVLPGQERRAQKLVTKALGSDWKVKPIGDNLTEFEVTHKEETLSVKEAWDKTYYLRSQPGVVDAQPLFAVPLSDRPYVPRGFSSRKPSPQISDLGHSAEQSGVQGALRYRPEWSQEFFRQPQANFEFKAVDESADVESTLKQMRVFEAWSRFFPDPNQPPGHGIIIGLPDTGYTEHPEIIENLLLEQAYNFLKDDKDAKDELDTSRAEVINNPGHGTSTASVIISPKGGQGNYPSGKTVTGVAPGAQLVPLRVSYSVVLLSVRNLAEAIEYAADQGIHVLSISLGTGFANQRLRSAITYAQKRGVIVVAAAGTLIPFVVWPAAYDEVIAVTGSNVRREIWWGSSRGSQVDVTAPGESVWYAKADKKNGELKYDVRQGSGTSFSAPEVAGVAALWLSYHGREQLIERYGAEKIPFIFNQILRDSCENFRHGSPTSLVKVL
ncbi:hypothetical protein BZZ01_31830 [Nostocales cyanobacterium HT-58-2]|nr:hypothetical protein BZZ01_31830 [Nostocales cyanobacterium HT-58-2]